MIVIGTILSYVNLVLMGMGANVWGKGTLMSGILLALLVVPVFIWRHYLVDKGIFPKAMREDMSLDENGKNIICRAGILPYLVLLFGILIVYFSSVLVAD